MYLSYNNSIETFADKSDPATYTDGAGAQNNMTSNKMDIGKEMAGTSGDPSPNAYYLANIHIQRQRTALPKNGEKPEPFPNDYYFITTGPLSATSSSGIVGTQKTFCILDRKYFGGGWMLAMRAVKGSKRFNFGSRYWYTNDKYKDDEKSISDLIPTLNSESDRYNISSIGNLIYDKPKGMSDDDYSNNYDLKNEIFNSYPINDCMIIFYKKNDKPNPIPIIGGDSYQDDSIKSWVWYQGNINKGNPISLLDYYKKCYSWENPASDNFDKATHNGGNNNFCNTTKPLTFNNLTELKNFSKLKSTNTPTLPNTPAKDYHIFPDMYNNSVPENTISNFGINYHISSKQGLRWGLTQILSSTTTGIGIGANIYSCCSGSESLAFELYVR